MQSVAATLNVTSLYHDTLLEKVARDDPRYKPLLPSTPHTRYTRAWASRVDGYKWTARMLEVIKFTQLFVEMSLRRNVKPKAKWRFVVLLESIK
jgi:peroxin-16